MENTFSISDPPTTVTDANAFTTTTNTVNMGCVPSSYYFQPMNFSSSLTAQTLAQQCFLPAQHGQQPPCLQTPQFPHFYQPHQAGQPFAAYPVYPFWFGQNGVDDGGAGNNGLFQPTGLTTKEQQRGFMDPQRTKFARIKRKLARQKALSLQRSASSGSSSGVASSIQVHTRRLDHNRDLYNFCTPENKRLRVLLKKQLKKSDVGSLGRIVLPKREAEENLPGLSDKEGIQIVMRDVYSDQAWTLKFKYWSNNKSRMYVLENTGDFVKQNGVVTGDSLTLYEDESVNFYFSIEKVVRQAAEPSNSTSNNNQTYNCPPLNQARYEEEASLELLIQQLNHKEQQEANYNFMTSPMYYAFSHRQPEEANEGPCQSTYNINHSLRNHPRLMATVEQPASFSNSKRRLVDGHDHQTNNATDDCYGGLDMLPDVNEYNFSL